MALRRTLRSQTGTGRGPRTGTGQEQGTRTGQVQDANKDMNRARTGRGQDFHAQSRFSSRKPGSSPAPTPRQGKRSPNGKQRHSEPARDADRGLTMLEHAASPLVIRFFGPLDVSLNGAPMAPLRSRRGQWLLALLALRAGRKVDRG